MHELHRGTEPEVTFEERPTERPNRLEKDSSSGAAGRDKGEQRARGSNVCVRIPPQLSKTLPILLGSGSGVTLPYLRNLRIRVAEACD